MAIESDLNTRIRGAVKAELARRDLSGVDLVEPLGMGRNAVYSRLNGDQAFTTVELEQIARFLGIPLETLFASAALPLAVAS